MKNRKPNRKKEYDYSQDGFYFVTIVTRNRENLFGEITNNEMKLNKFGEIAKECWAKIPEHFAYSKLHEFIIMPNHIHGIVEIDNSVGKAIIGNAIVGNTIVGNADLRSLRGNTTRSQYIIDRTKMKLSKLIHGFKSSVTRNIRKQYDYYEFGWQKSFHDRIIRDEKEYINIRNYIINNPINWEIDGDTLLNVHSTT